MSRWIDLFLLRSPERSLEVKVAYNNKVGRSFLLGNDIETLSFKLIQKEVNLSGFDLYEREVVARVVHASAEPSYVEEMSFSQDVVRDMVASFKDMDQVRIVTDVTSLSHLIYSDATVSAFELPYALLANQTRSYAAMRHAAQVFGDKDTIYVIGCAPTALEALLDLAAESKFSPLIVAMPVGFVGAYESKTRLVKEGRRYITNLSRRGGTAVTAGAVNAVIKMAKGTYQIVSEGEYGEDH
jgi:precorrin-8X/cobalt-precorrin-8 methylmutase